MWLDSQGIRHSRAELAALHTLDHAWANVEDDSARSLLLAAIFALKYHYPGERQRALLDHWNILRTLEQ